MGEGKRAMPAAQARAATPSGPSQQAVSGETGIPIAGHTPLPWFAHRLTIASQNDSLFVAEADCEEDTAFIVRACNSHYELLSALELVRMSFGWGALSDDTKRVIDAALAKAGAQ